LATSVTLQRRAGIAGKLLAALLVLALLWLIGSNVSRMVLQRANVAGAKPGPLPVQNSAQSVVAANLFGAAPSAPTGEAQATTLNLKLKGVYAAQRDFSGFAILSVDGRPDVGVLAGSEIKPGIKLHAVNADYVLIFHDGLIERVNLASTRIAPVTPGQLANGQPVHVHPTSAHSFSVSRSEFTSLLSDPRQIAMLALLGTSAEGGIVINDAADTALINKLGLKQGDIIQKINGQVVAGKDDLLKIAMRSPDTNEVTVEGMRSGLPLRLTYNVQP
jgi:type II secretory pathway component PulC